MTKFKDAPVRIKAGPDDGLAEGEFTAYASVFGNQDSYGDIVVKGAFKDTLETWAKSGNNLPLLFGHRMDDPDFNIGHVKSYEEDDHGLLVTCQLDLESPKALQTYRLLKGRRINQMSYAYDVIDGEEKDGAYLLKSMKLHEISVVPVGANQETEVLAVKAFASALQGAKAGRVLSQKNIDSLRTAQEAIGKVIEDAEASNDQGKASDAAEAKSGASDEESTGAKSSVPNEEPKSGQSSVNTLLTLINLQEMED